jgi:hypothetical protein
MAGYPGTDFDIRGEFNAMTRLTILASTLALAGLLSAQSNPLISEAKQSYTGVKNNLIRMAEKVPEDLYSFKPVAEIRTFGELVAHVADSQTGNCTAAKGERKPGTAKGKTTKADLVAALKASFGECDAAFDSLTDANITEMAGRRSKLGTLVGVIGHSSLEYGYMAVYLRLKNIVPPSSDKTP